MNTLAPFPGRLLLAAVSLTVFAAPRLAADSLTGGQSTAYSTVINFDRTDYYVSERYNSNTSTAALANLQTAILFDNRNPFVPDAAGNLNLPADFATRLANMRAASPNAGYTLGVMSLNAIAGNSAAIANFNSQLNSLISTYGFTGVDIDWEDMPGNVSAATYGNTVKAVAAAVRAAAPGTVISTSHATGAHYKPYVAQIASTVDFLNLQFYYSTTGAMNMNTFKSTLTGYLDQGLQASQIRVGLPSYAMVNPNATSTTDKWRSWNNLIDKGVDVTNLNQWTDPSNGETYYFSGLNLIESKLEYAKSNGFAGVFTWELTQDQKYTNPLSVNALIDQLSVFGTPSLELNDSNIGTTKLGTGKVTLGTGAVLNNGILRFARTAAATHANRIDGYGRLEVTGTGAVTLTGANTYEGGTYIAAGSRLNIGNGGISSSVGDGDVLNNGVLAFNHSDNATLNNVVTGTGTFLKSGSGVLTLSGADKSFGALRVTGGTLESDVVLDIAGNALIGDGAVGVFRQTAGVVNITKDTSGWGDGLNIGHRTNGVGTYDLSGGTLNVLNAATVVGAGGGSTGVFAVSGGTANFKGLVLGTSNTDRSTVTLTGGRLNIGEAGIAIGSAAPTGPRAVNLGAGTVGALADWSSSLGMTLTDASTGVTVDTQNAATGLTGHSLSLSGVLSGIGKLNKVGAGTLVLSGANTFAGGTVVSGGTLVAGHSSALGAGGVTIASGGTLVVGSADAASVSLGSGASLVVDAGGVFKVGAVGSELILSGAGGYDFSGALDLNGIFDGVGGTVSYTLISGGTGTKSENLSGIVGYDASRVSASFDQGVLTVTAIPEPSTYGLLGAGALVAVALVRRRKASKKTA